MAEQGLFAIDTGNAELHFKDAKLLKISTTRIGYPHIDIPIESTILKVSA